MNKLRIAVVLLSLAGLLAACEITITSGMPDYDVSVTAQTYEASNLANAPALDVFTLGPGESIRYRVGFADTRRDASYYIVDAPFELVLLDRFEAAIASSSTPDFFRSGRQGATTASATAAPAGIGAALVCPGPCVIEPSGASPRYVDIVNPTGSTISGEFRALHRDFEDDNETAAGAAPLGLGTTEGALEALRDVDSYIVQTTGDLTLNGASASGLDYVVEVLISGGPNVVIEDGQTDFVVAGDEILVYATNGESRAASAGKSRYFLQLD
jgi:hypothetical protein